MSATDMGTIHKEVSNWKANVQYQQGGMPTVFNDQNAIGSREGNNTQLFKRVHPADLAIGSYHLAGPPKDKKTKDRSNSIADLVRMQNLKNQYERFSLNLEKVHQQKVPQQNNTARLDNLYDRRMSTDMGGAYNQERFDSQTADG